MKKKRLRKLNTKLTLIFAGFAVLLGVFISGFSYRTTWNQATSFYSEKARQAATLAAGYVDGDRVGRYLETMETDDAYEAMEAALTEIKRSMGLSYLYVFIPGSDSFTYIVDIQLEDEDPEYFSALGDVYEYTELEYEHLVPDVEAKQASQDVIVSRSSLFFGSGVFTWAPVFDSRGDLAAMVEADITLELMEESIRNSLIVMLCVYLAMIALMIALQSIAIRRMITLPLQKLTDRALEFAAEGELSEFVDDIKTGDELQTLSESFGKMALDITAYTQEKSAMAADQERIATELQVATDMQQSMLPRELTDFPGGKYMDIQGQIQISRKMGGNFYDYFVLDDHRVGVVMCGMQDTGITAAMMLVVTRTIIKSQFLSDRKLAETMAEINRQIYDAMDQERAISAFAGILDVSDGRFTYVNAGFNAPVVMRQGERYEFLTSPAYVPLGTSENVSYRELSLQLRQGDRLLFYSDGIINAKASGEERYGQERLRTRLNTDRNKDLGLEQLMQGIFQESAAFTGASEPESDLVLLALEYKRGNRDQAQLVLPPDMGRVRELQAFLKEQLTMNRVEGKTYAQIQVCAEELFSICCRCARGTRIEVDCAVPSADKLVLRMSMNLRGVNPLADEQNTVVQSAAAFIRKNAESLEWMEQDNKSILVMTRRL